MTESLKKALSLIDDDTLRQLVRHCQNELGVSDAESLQLPFTERWKIVRSPEFRALRALAEACEEVLVVKHVNWTEAQKDV